MNQLMAELHLQIRDKLTNIAHTLWGKGILLFLMIALMIVIKDGHHYTWKLLMIVVAACAAYIPNYRPQIVLGGTVALAFHKLPASFGAGMLYHHVLPVVVLFLIAYLLLKLAKEVGRKHIFAYPVTFLLFVMAGLIVLSQVNFVPAYVRNVLWELAIILSFAKWFLAYAINNITSRKPGSFIQNLGVLHPFWGSSQTPYGKGWSYIRKFEAKNPTQLASVQVKALELLFSVAVLKVFLLIWHPLVMDHINSPYYYMMELVQGSHPNRLEAAISLPIYFITTLIYVSIWGNSMIAVARFAGYDLKRNTVNPLFSNSIADFWNRYVFYFKELLVEFFFMPTFQRTAFLPERLRIFLATLMAAGFGNYIYHIARDFAIIENVGIISYLSATKIYAVYSFALGVGIGISQAMNPFTASDGEARSFKPHICLGVVLFFCLIGILGDEEPYKVIHEQHNLIGISDYLKFYGYLCYLV